MNRSHVALAISLAYPFCLFGATVPAAAQGHSATNADAAVLTVRVVDLRNKKGHLRLGVFDRSAGFPGERGNALLWKSVPADSDHRSFSLELPRGQYAVVVLHDENGNKKLDTNLIGIPKEGYGVSNNPKPKRRAATFQEARFTLPPGGASMTVSIQYS